MDKIKRFLAILVSTLMLFTSMPSFAFAEDENQPEGNPADEQTKAFEEYDETHYGTDAKYKYFVEWNDNEDETLRPDMNEYFNGTENSASEYVEFRVKIGDSEQFVPLDKDVLEQLGLEDYPEFYEVTRKNEHEWDGVVALPTSFYNVHYVDLNEDGVLSDNEKQVAEEEGKKSETSLEWRVLDKSNSIPEGYFIDAEEITERTTKIEYTLLTDYKAYVVWRDNADRYDSRPDQGEAGKGLTPEDFDVYRIIKGETTPECMTRPELEGYYNVKLEYVGKDEENDDKYEITLGELPMYDPIGKPYEYYTVLKKNNNTPVQEKDGKIVAIEGIDKGVYPVIYDNKDNYASDVDKLDPEGTLNLILENTTDFQVTKVWEGRVARPENCVLYLYRLAEDDNGKVDLDSLNNASPVQSFDSEKVPYVDESGEPKNGDTFPIVFKDDQTDSTELPMYDNDGHRYVYFAIEKNMSNDWSSIITHEDEAAEYSSQSVIDVVDEYNATKGAKYVLNRGVITNTRTRINTQAPVKQFVGKAMQNMNAEVQMQLQVKTADGWVLYTDEENPNGFTSVITGFSQEDTTVQGKSVEVNKYDPDGNKYEYRWVETGIKLAGQNDYVPVTYTENENGDIEYDEYNENVVDGQNAPGINGDGTTARFEPTQDGDNKVVNTLVGDTQVVIRKKWYDENGKNRVLDPDFMAGKKATFEVVRILDSKETVCEVEISLGADGVKEVKGDAADGSEDYLEYVITKEKDSRNPDADPLTRYDEEGREYIYDVVEKDDRGATYYSERSVVLDENGENYITQLETLVVNGVGDGLVFDVDKKWLDDSDLETRKPVTVQLFEKVKNADGSITLKEVKPLDKTIIVLNEENNWFSKINIPTNGKTVDDFVVLETAVGDVPVDRINDISDSEVVKRIANKSTDGSNSEYADSNIIGVVDEGDGECNGVHYKYDVFASKGKTYGQARSEYTITNRRVAVINLDLVKKWLAGGTAPNAKFTVSRTDATGKTEPITSFVLSPEGIVTANGAVQEDGIVSVVKAGFISSLIGSFSNPEETNVEVTIKDLPKYDELGRMYTYHISENGMYDSNGELHPNVDGVVADVDGSTYLSKASTTVELAECYNSNIKKGHHSGDIYKWVISNKRSQSQGITVNKVWRDDGKSRNIKARPDIRFNLYRVAISDDVLEDLMKEGGQYTHEALAKYLNDSLKNIVFGAKAEPVAEDKLWDTKHNDWYWSCDIAGLPRYDSNGYKYVYFIKEVYPGEAGDYYMMYSNEGAEVAPKKKAEDGSEFTATEQVFGLDESRMPKDDATDADKRADKAGVLIVSVGEDNDFSRTVVNGRIGVRTVSGTKYWMLPEGWSIPDSEKPVIEMQLFRTTENLYKAMTAEQIHEAIKEDLETQGGRFEMIMDDNNEPDMRELSHDAGWNFKYENQAKYNQYGTRYFYYPYEVSELSVYNPSVQENQSNTTYSLINTYNFGEDKVEVEVTKEWKDEYNPETHRMATFELWAQATNEDGTDDENIPAVKMSTKTIDVANEKVTFDKCTDVAGNANTDLPLIGPNGNEFRYFVKEIVTPGYTSTDYDVDGKEVAKENNEGEGAVAIVRDVTLAHFAGKYIGSVTYDNEYTGGHKDISLSKSWDWNGYTADEAYRPFAGVQFKVYRSWNAVTVKGNDGRNVTYDEGSELFDTAVLSSSNDWTYVKNNVAKYAPNGKEYTYYITDEKFVDENGDEVDAETKAKVESFFKGEKSGNNYKNTFRTVTFKASKNWTNDETGKTLTKEEIQNLIKLGLLPGKMKFQLWRKVEGGTWTPYGTAKEVNTADATTSDGKVKGDLAKWSGLPKYDTDGNLYIYAAQEEISGKLFPANDDDITNAAKTGDKVSIADGTEGFTPSVGAVSKNTGDPTQTQSVTFKNELDMTKIRVKKVWDDMGNFDNVRPKDIKFMLKPTKSTDENSAVKEVTLSNLDGDDNEWISDYIFYTMASTAKFDPSKYILVAEGDLPDYYIQGTPEWKAEKNADGVITGWTASIKNSTYNTDAKGRLYVSIEAEKEWAGDDAVKDIARPDEIKFAVYYKQHNANTWEFLSKDKALEIYNNEIDTSKGGRLEPKDEHGVKTIRAGLVKAGLTQDYEEALEDYEPVKTANAGNSWTVTWDDVLAKHWYIPKVDGVADPVEYKVVEVTVDAQGNVTPVTNDDDYGYTVDNSNAEAKPEKGENADANLYKASITNTLKTTSVSVKKAWEGDYDDYNKLRPKNGIKVKLQAKAGTTDVTIPREIETIVLTADNNWSASYTNLPAYDKNGVAIDYSVKEVDPGEHYEGAEPGVTKNTDGTFSISVTNTLQPLPVEFNKALLVNEECGSDPDAIEALSGITFKVFFEGITEVATATSDTEGKVKFDVDRNGVYKIVEQDQPEGSPVINDGKPYYFKIDGYAWNGQIYSDEACETALPDNTVINDQIRGNINLVKTDEAIGLSEDGTVEYPLEGAEFGLYRQTADGQIEVTTATTGADGKISFEGLPTGYIYTIKELVPPIGYYLSEKEIKVTFENVDGKAVLKVLDDGDGTIELQSDETLVWLDAPVVVKVMKVTTKGKYLAGAELQIIDADGEVLAEWTTTGEPDIIDLTGQVIIGDKLTLHEVKAPKGYDLAKDVEFEIPAEAVGPHADKVIEVKMVDRKTPVIDTGDRAPLVPLIFTGLASTLALLVLLINRKKFVR